MNIKTLNVFYGEDFLPYKDNAREVHYPNVGSDFQGANEISEIHFYTDRIGDTGSTTFAVAIELPNGKIGSKVIAQSEYDDELHENYVVLPIDDFITRYVGNVTISLRGYQGDIELEYDDESQLYVLSGGTPITAVTGGIKLRVNQVPQGLQGDLDEEVTLQQLLGLVANKLDIDKGIVILGDISTANLSGYEVGQLFYDKDSGTYYEKTATSPHYKKAGDESGVLGSANILCKNGDSTLTISKLHEIYGNRSYFVYRYLDKDILFNINQVALNDYNCIAFDIESKCFYEKAVVSGSALPSSVLIPANKVEIASKAFLSSNYVPYNGANADVDLGEHKISAKELDLPNSKIRTDSIDDNATLLDGKFLYGNEHTDEKEDERAVASVKYALEQHIKLTTSDGGAFTSTQYAYISKHNATIVDKSGKTYRFINEDDSNIYYGCFNGETNTSLGATPIRLGNILKVAKTPSNNEYDFVIKEVNFEVYSTSQAKDKFATNFTWEIDNTTYVMTFTLKNANGSTLVTHSIDLPLESIVTSMTYYDEYTYGGTTYHNVLVIVLATTSVPTIVPVGSLISGLEHEALIEVSDISTPLTASQLALLEYPNAMITYGNDVYLKAEDNGTYITLSVPYISLATNSGHEEATRKFIVVTKSSGAMALTSDTTSFYNKSQADSLLGEKADASSVVTDSDIETLGGAVNRIRKGNTWNVVAQEVNMSTTPKVVQSVADLPADNDGYLYVVLDNGYLYSWDEENQEWAQQYQYTSDLLTITEVAVGDDDYSYIADKTNSDRPIQVESAKKDANGDVIDETYAKISDLETIDERLDNHDTDIAKLKKDVDYAMKYPLLYGTPTTDTEEEVGLTTSQLPATTLPKGLINYVGGMSQKVNQLYDISDYTLTRNNVTIVRTASNYTISFTTNGTASGSSDLPFGSTAYVPNHKYLLHYNGTKTDLNIIIQQTMGYTWVRNKNTSASNDSIFSYTETDANRLNFVGGFSNGSVPTANMQLMLVDLTEIYGSGNEPTTTSDARIQWLIHYLISNPQYDEGSIVNAPVENIVSKGFNIWNEEWELGAFSDNGSEVSSSVNIRTKNNIKVLPNTIYYLRKTSGNYPNGFKILYLDSNGNVISSEAMYGNNVFTTPSGCSSIKWYAYSSVTTYNHDICINLSGAMNGTYLPYQAPSDYPIPSEVQALDGYGLGFDDTLYNYIDFENKKFVKKVVEIDLGALNWYYNGTGGFMYASLTIAPKVDSNSFLTNKMCSAFELVDGAVETTQHAIQYYSNYLRIKDTNYSSGADFKNAMNGVMLVYEIETPIETDISEYLDRDFPNENLIDTYQGGEVEFENDNDMGVPYSLTYQYKIE